MDALSVVPEKKHHGFMLPAALGLNAAAWLVYLVGEFLLAVEKTPHVFFFSSIFVLVLLGVVVLVTSAGILVMHCAIRRARIALWIQYLCYALPGMMMLSAIGFYSYNDTVPAGVIINAGTYPSPSRKWELVITRGEGTLIHYEIQQAGADRSFVPKVDFSDVHRWFFYWENDRRLWCHSSDIGTSVWIRHDDGDWQQEWLSSKLKIPQAVAGYLPKSVK